MIKIGNLYRMSFERFSAKQSFKLTDRFVAKSAPRDDVSF
jgi:hypothetical protein